MGSLIERPRVLTEDYVPDSFVHREGEHQEIADNLRPMMDGEPPQDMLLHGPPGVGKTAMSRFVVRKMKEEVDVREAYVNGFRARTRFEVFYSLLDEPAKVPRDGTSTSKVVEEFKDRARSRDTVIVVDEVDQLRDDEILYELSRFRRSGVIYIANDPLVFSRFENRVRSRLGDVAKMEFTRYSSSELSDILRHRASNALRDGAVSDTEIDLIVSRAEGDARIAISSLKKASYAAQDRDLDIITEEVVEESVKQAYSEDRIDSLDRLNEHQKQVYRTLQRSDSPMGMGQLFDTYRTEMDDPRSRRTLRRYIRKMEAYGIVEAEGEKSARTYSLAD